MKKYLLLLVLPFLFLNNVYAEEYKSCYDQYKIGNVSFGDFFNRWRNILPLIPVTESSTKYYVRFFPSQPYTGYDNNYFYNTPKAVKSDGTESNYYMSDTSFDVTNQVLSFTTKSSAINFVGLRFVIYSTSSNYQVMDNAPVIMSTNLNDLLSCEDSPSDNVYSSFITLYLDRISYLANGFTTNPYLLSMAGIIFAFIVLELFLHIFHIKGGYRK